MKKTIDTLINRLYSKDVLPLEVPRLIRDVLYIVKVESSLSVESINMRLRALGWEEQVLYEFILQLILLLLETQGDHPIESTLLH